MKKLISITSMIIIAIAMLWHGCTRPEETGGIYGTITDFETGEPVKNANVTLRPSGETTLTGSDGTYMFQDLKKGDYSLSLKLAGYEDLDDQYVIHLETGKNVRRDVQMKKKVALRITDENGNETSVLDFGDESDDVSRIFNIVNESGTTLSWEITTTADWIQSPTNGTNGTLQPGATKGIVVKIDRSKLQQGDNTTTMHITSNNGNQQLTIKARRTDVSTLDATAVNSNSAVLNGKINTNKPYSEKGFYYGTNHNLSNKVVVNGSGTGTFSTQITGLSGVHAYYFKAYCIIDGECIYGEEKSFGPVVTSTFEFNGHTYMVAPDPHTSYDQYISWSAANSYCENLTCWGYSDWRLPTIEELETMYQLREAIGGFIRDTSWCTGGIWHNYHSVYHSSTVGSYYTYHYYVEWNSGSVSNNVDIEISGYCAGYAQQYAHVRPIRVAD